MAINWNAPDSWWKEAELAHLAEFLHCDFLDVEARDNSFDAAFSIEATACAPDKISIYGEIFRLLKPGSRFACYEYIMTDRFDPQDPHQLKIKADIQLGGGLTVIDDKETVDNALRTVGFEVLETRDLAAQTGPSIPWYQPLVGEGLSLAGFRSSRVGRWVTHNTLRVLEGTSDFAAGNGPGSGDFESLRPGHGGGGPARHLHPDVLHPRPETGIGWFDPPNNGGTEIGARETRVSQPIGSERYGPRPPQPGV